MSTQDDDVPTDVEELRKLVLMLQKQLAAVGVDPTAAAISLDEAKEQLGAALNRLMGGDMSAQAEYDKWDRLVSCHPEHLEEQERLEQEWEDNIKSECQEALVTMQGIVPKNIKDISLAELGDLPGMHKSLAKRISRKRALWLLHTPPADIAKFHAADLMIKYTVNGLDFRELKALYAVVPEEMENDGDGRKAEWREQLREKVKEFSNKHANGKLEPRNTISPDYSEKKKTSRRNSTGSFSRKSGGLLGGNKNLMASILEQKLKLKGPGGGGKIKNKKLGGIAASLEGKLFKGGKGPKISGKLGGIASALEGKLFKHGTPPSATKKKKMKGKLGGIAASLEGQLFKGKPLGKARRSSMSMMATPEIKVKRQSRPKSEKMKALSANLEGTLFKKGKPFAPTQKKETTRTSPSRKRAKKQDLAGMLVRRLASVQAALEKVEKKTKSPKKLSVKSSNSWIKSKGSGDMPAVVDTSEGDNDKENNVDPRPVVLIKSPKNVHNGVTVEPPGPKALPTRAPNLQTTAKADAAESETKARAQSDLDCGGTPDIPTPTEVPQPQPSGVEGPREETDLGSTGVVVSENKEITSPGNPSAELDVATKEGEKPQRAETEIPEKKPEEASTKPEQSVIRGDGIVLSKGIVILATLFIFLCAGVTAHFAFNRFNPHGHYKSVVWSSPKCKSEVFVPEGVTDIPDMALFGCTSITTLHLPSTLKKIGKNAFNGCTNLQKIENVPRQLNFIGDNAFKSCNGLTEVRLPKKVKVGTDAFHGCTNLILRAQEDGQMENGQNNKESSNANYVLSSTRTPMLPQQMHKIARTCKAKGGYGSGCVYTSAGVVQTVDGVSSPPIPEDKKPTAEQVAAAAKARREQNKRSKYKQWQEERKKGKK